MTPAGLWTTILSFEFGVMAVIVLLFYGARSRPREQSRAVRISAPPLIAALQVVPLITALRSTQISPRSSRIGHHLLQR